MSREHSGKILLVSTKEILQNLHFKFQISEPHGLQILKFLIFSGDELVVGNEENDRWKMRRMIGKPNCCLTSINLSAFLTMFMLNFVTVPIPVLFR